ncbi:HD-GYP domain-containing protein [Actinomycetes bacterium NPDC127524]
MRLVTIDSVKPGDKLGRNIYNDNGNILLAAGKELSEKLINRLVQLDIPFAYIEDEQTTHIKPGTSIPEQLRREAADTIKKILNDIKHENSVSASFIVEKAVRNFSGLIRSIIGEIKGNKELLSLLADVYTYDNYIFTHSLNVTLYTLAIGIELKLNQKQAEILGLGAILHDVGKMLVPAQVLMKEGRLTEEEFQMIKKHSEFGFHLLKGIHTLPLLVAHCAYQHHERLDGSGYPRGLVSDEIHQFGKIIAVADVFDAVTSNRVYRKAMLPHEGLEILYAGSGSQFDPNVIEAFRKAVAIYPTGLTVELSDGRKGVVSAQNSGMSERPKIFIMEQEGRKLDHAYEINLQTETSLMIVQCMPE